MGYDDNGVVEVDKELFKPADCFEIEVVGGLVEKKDIGITEKCLCKEDLDLLGTVEFCHLCIVIFRSDSETVKKHSRIGLCLISVHLRKLALKLTCSDSVLVGEILFHIDGIFFLHDVIEVLISHDHGIHYGKLIIFKVVLLED